MSPANRSVPKFRPLGHRSHPQTNWSKWYSSQYRPVQPKTAWQNISGLKFRRAFYICDFNLTCRAFASFFIDFRSAFFFFCCGLNFRHAFYFYNISCDLIFFTCLVIHGSCAFPFWAASIYILLKGVPLITFFLPCAMPFFFSCAMPWIFFSDILKAFCL